MLLIEEHALLLEGLRLLLEVRGRMEVVGAAADVRAALCAEVVTAPDVIMLDLPGGEPAIATALYMLRRRWPAAKVLALLLNPSRQHITSALLAGVGGLLAQSCETYELLHAVRYVAKGGRYLSGDLAHCLAEGHANQPASHLPDPMQTLSAREREVLRMVAQGESSPAIAQRLGLSANTVDTYRSRVRAKLGVESTADLVKFAIRNQLVPIE